jgi:hypothetical protein
MESYILDEEKREHLIKSKEKELRLILEICPDIYDWSFENNDTCLFVNILFEDGNYFDLSFYENNSTCIFQQYIDCEKSIFDCVNFLNVTSLLQNLYNLTYGKERFKEYKFNELVKLVNNVNIIDKKKEPIDDLIDSVCNNPYKFVIENNTNDLASSNSQNSPLLYPRDAEKYIGMNVLDVIDELKKYNDRIVIIGNVHSSFEYEDYDICITISTQKIYNRKNIKNRNMLPGTIEYIGYKHWS